MKLFQEAFRTTCAVLPAWRKGTPNAKPRIT